MPQFDFFSFFIQVLWFSTALCMFYLLLLKYKLAKTHFLLTFRQKIASVFTNATTTVKAIFTKKIKKD